MITVYKYPVQIADAFDVEMPEKSKFLHIGLDPASGDPMMWWFVDTESKKITRHFAVVGTGHPAEHVKEYYGTVVRGPFVWHLFRM